MLDKVFGEVITRKEEIRSKISKRENLDVELDKFWNVSDEARPEEHIGVDAGRNHWPIRGNILAVVNAGAMGRGELLAQRIFVDFIIPPGHPEVRITNFDVILKTKVVLDLLNRGVEDLILVDGSFESDVSKPRWGKLSFSLDGLDLDDLLSVPIYSQSGDFDLCGVGNKECYTEFEFAEKLFLLREVARRKGCVYISKTTVDNRLVRELLGGDMYMSDISMLYILNPPPGYSDPRGPHRVDFPGVQGGIGDIMVSYVRLRPRGPILRVEYPPGSWRMEELFPILRGRHMDGYPYWLARVDKDVRVTKADLDRVMKLLGVEHLPSGREMLL